MAKIPVGHGGMKQLMKRFDAAAVRFNQWRSLHQEAMDFSAPQRETFSLHSPGQTKNRFVYDSTAEEGLDQFTSRLQGSLVPAQIQWMKLTAGDDIPKNEKEEVDKALAEATDTFFTHLNHSNFDTEITPSLTDLGIGTGCIMVEENDFNESSAVIFTNIPLAELYVEKPARGPIKNIWRKQKVEAGSIKTTWPDADIPTNLQKIIDKDPSSEVDILNAMLFNTKSKKYDQIVIWEKKAIFSQSFNTRRMIAFRWKVTPGEVYGRGPAISKLPDIRTVNKIVEIRLGNGAIQMSGIYTGRSDGIFNPHTVTIAPGSIIAVGSNDNTNPTIRALTPSGNINITLEDLQDGRENIRKAFFSSPLGEISDPVRSATENILRNQEFLKNSGASIGRQMSEFVEPMVAAVVDILKERGKIPDIEVNGKDVTIKQTSPLAKAADQEAFQNTQLWLSSMAQFVPPEVMALKVKIESLPREFAQQLGINPDLVRSDAETKEVASQVQAAAQAGLEGGAPNEPAV
jgi:hypothetical protein